MRLRRVGPRKRASRSSPLAAVVYKVPQHREGVQLDGRLHILLIKYYYTMRYGEVGIRTPGRLLFPTDAQRFARFEFAIVRWRLPITEIDSKQENHNESDT